MICKRMDNEWTGESGGGCGRLSQHEIKKKKLNKHISESCFHFKYLCRVRARCCSLPKIFAVSRNVMEIPREQQSGDSFKTAIPKKSSNQSVHLNNLLSRLSTHLSRVNQRARVEVEKNETPDECSTYSLEFQPWIFFMMMKKWETKNESFLIFFSHHHSEFTHIPRRSHASRFTAKFFNQKFSYFSPARSLVAFS